MKKKIISFFKGVLYCTPIIIFAFTSICMIFSKNQTGTAYTYNDFINAFSQSLTYFGNAIPPIITTTITDIFTNVFEVTNVTLITNVSIFFGWQFVILILELIFDCLTLIFRLINKAIGDIE